MKRGQKRGRKSGVVVGGAGVGKVARKARRTGERGRPVGSGKVQARHLASMEATLVSLESTITALRLELNVSRDDLAGALAIFKIGVEHMGKLSEEWQGAMMSALGIGGSGVKAVTVPVSVPVPHVGSPVVVEQVSQQASLPLTFPRQ